MSDIALLPFQTIASEQITARFVELQSDKKRPWEHASWMTPFYQALSSLTGSGKTPILADAVTNIRAVLPYEPIVLWISKAKAVVEQTRKNFEAGGKYAHLLDSFVVTSLSELDQAVINDATTPVIVMATVGTFNQKDKQDGTLRVHKVDDDKADDSLWNLLQHRPAEGNTRRPLVVVYDEAHNLSDQQADLILELEPDAMLVASATMKTPGRLGKLIQRLKDHGLDDDKLVTTIPSSKVVNAGLIKKQIILGGYDTLMESAIDEMLDTMAVVETKADLHGAGFTPKAIYVCRTNISQDDGTPDNPSRPFRERKAPPILIWRYLVEKKGVDPAKIAVYCDLKFNRDNQPPEDFVHFSGGEDDFGAFSAGGYKHIIFNLSLQEGWDDPECCFAYIDKSMGSGIQVEQVIGRVLRQPGAEHYADPDLNTANFYIRIGAKQEFPQILETVRRKIAAEYPEVKLDAYADRKERDRIRKEPKETLTAPQIHIDLEAAITFDGGTPQGPFIEAIAKIPDFRSDTANTVGKGERLRAVQVIGDGGKVPIETSELHHSNRVMARWIVRRTIQSLYPPAIMSIDWSAVRFDARVEITSVAAHTLRTTAEQLVGVYLEHAELAFEEENLYTVGPVVVNPKKLVAFTNAAHEGYSDLNTLEEPFAHAIDETGNRWARNPSNGGFFIPLLQTGDTRRFFPDFLVWKDKVIFALDTKGAHLINTDAGRKLLSIRDEKSKERVVVRLFTEGKWQDTTTKTSDEGFTLWSIKSGQIKPRHFPTIAKAVEAALKV